MNNEIEVAGPDGGASSQRPDDVGFAATSPWEEIASGRFRPRRIRGSYRGRELG